MYKLPKKQLLSFINNKNLYENVEAVLNVAHRGIEDSETKLYSNVIDPFSALFEAMSIKMKLSGWIKKEKSRQLQKTIQNAIGVFHQEILGSFPGWKSLGTGSVVDLVNEDLKIIAEVKNKYNTTKGNHKTVIYDDLKSVIKEKRQGYTGYYVEIISSGKKQFDKEFTPSDNRKSKKRPKNKNIRIIDGKSFYALASEDGNAIENLYNILPQVIGDIMGTEYKKIMKEDKFKELFERAY